MRRYTALLLSLLLLLAMTSGAAALPLAPLPTRTVTVSVLSHDGKALTGANVQLLTPGQTGMVTGRTDIRGQAGLTIPPGFTYWLRVWADGHTVAEQPYVPASDGMAVTVNLQAHGSTLTGIVTDEKGRPVSGALLTVWRDGYGQHGSVKTDAAGLYAIDGLPASGTYSLRAEARAFQPFVQSNLTLAAGARTQADVSLTPAHGTITGEVIDSRTGLPVSNVRAELHLSGWGLAAHVQTDAFGFFRLAAPAGATDTYQVRLRADGYELLTTASFPATAGGWTDFTGEDRLELNPLYAELSGMVLDGSGQPLGQTRVELQREGLGTVETAVTDPDGFYQFTRIPAGNYRVRALPDFQIRGDSGWLLLNGGDLATADVYAGSPDLTSYGSSAITGTVRDHRGTPVSGATVTLSRGNGTQTAQTDSLGRYRFSIQANIEDKLTEPKTSTGYHITVAKDGYIGTDLWQTRDGAVTPGLMDVRAKTTGRADFTLYPAQGELAGLVLDDRGAAVVGVQVQLRQEGGGTVAAVRTDENGRYRFPSLEVAKQARYLPVLTGGTYVESVTLPSGAVAAPLSLTPGATVTRTIAARPAEGRIQGLVLAGPEKPAAGATVRVIRPADGGVWTGEVKADGSYAIAVPAGPGSQYLVEVAGERLTTAANQNVISLADQYGATANLSAVPKATLNGRVFSASGQPLTNQLVVIWAEGEAKPFYETRTNALGTYTIEGLTPGRRYGVATVNAQGAWSWIAPGEPILSPLVTPAPGESIWVDLLTPTTLPAGIR